MSYYQHYQGETAKKLSEDRIINRIQILHYIYISNYDDDVALLLIEKEVNRVVLIFMAAVPLRRGDDNNDDDNDDPAFDKFTT